MNQIYKCKGCGGHLLYDPDTAVLKCEYCKNAVAINNQKTTELPTKINYSETYQYTVHKDAKKVYECPSCNSKLTTLSDIEISKCPSCGCNTLSEVQESGVHPMEIIPFKISNDKACEHFKAWLKTRKFAPNDLKKYAKQKKITGVYAPIYIFDLTATTNFSAVGINHEKDKQGHVVSSSSYHIKDKKITNFQNYILSANKNFNSSTFADFNGFSYSETMPYKSEYMLGFPGIGTDLNLQEGCEVMKSKISKSEQSKIESMLNFKYDEVNFFKADTSITDIKNGYVYVPIWTNHYRYKNKDYHCYINGQTGKVTGKSPKSFWKILFLVLGIAAIIFLLVFLLK